MTYIAKLSMPGYDVSSATPEQCALHSLYPPFKAKIGQSNPHFALLSVDFTGMVTQNVSHTVYSFNHGYGYVPLNFASIIFNDGVQDIVGLGFAGVGATLAIDAYCTASDFIVKVYDDGGWTNSNATLKVSYYVFAENGT